MIENRYVTLAYNEQYDCLQIKWTADTEVLTVQEFETVLNMVLEMIDQYKPQSILNNLHDFMSPMQNELHELITRHYLPEFHLAGIKYIALIPPVFPLAELSVELIIDSFETLPIEHKVFDNEPEAIDWLQSVK